jgi:hypothetical protein
MLKPKAHADKCDAVIPIHIPKKWHRVPFSNISQYGEMLSFRFMLTVFEIITNALYYKAGSQVVA